MLKRFFLNFLSSFAGAWVALGLFCVVLVMVGIGFLTRLSFSGPTEEVKSRSILKIKLAGTIEETETPGRPNAMSILKGDFEKPQTLNLLTKAIRESAANKNISAIYLECSGVAASPATLNALRETLMEFKKSGKKIYAYGDSYAMGDYYVASVADSIFVNPGGSVDLHGLGSTSLYMKDLFDKLGVTFQVVKVGTFKSAVEPYIMQEMSQPARAQLDTLFQSMWGYMKTEICKSRKGLTPSKIDELINNYSISFAPVETAAKANLVDRLVYRRVMNKILADCVDVDEKKLNFVSPSLIVSQTDWGTAYSSKRQIAVLYATGEIIDGSDEGINWETMVPQIIDLADDDNVKGMVLRVNSPGGSAFGSQQIGEALEYFRSKGKPMSVSMGDYAASGGYWISCGADMIYADALTITGSIGIFGLIPNVSSLASKLGVNPQTVNTNPGSNFPTLFSPLDEKQLGVMQAYVERGYDQFISLVAKGRKMPESKVRGIGEGRVWDALKAKQIGLIDSIGSLAKAVEWTANKADVKDNYDVALYPSFEPSVWDFIPANMGAEMRTALMMKMLKDDYSEIMVKFASSVLNGSKVQARMPLFEIIM